MCRKLFGASAAALAGNSQVTNDGAESNQNLNQKTMKTFGENNAYQSSPFTPPPLNPQEFQ
ncbi:hypothetical protein [Hyalangium minutum]|uniref:Uncharacterized protein n=1 Tax=Hyalangium minutum TaxID=394096 RepID=A0A085VSQ0_9BACT|nr:hypothetical protein [Hyalangium minutum]KFE58463.1 hypothetical protein DB31_6729 [Hyalangium minutum]KFE60701.1 hypothetical protein DB31_4883 [Hyalangium minutum]